jgi:GT2 family glycosyltransferase
LPEPRVTVIIPTLRADSALAECVRSLEAQTMPDFEIIVVDNSGQGLASRLEEVRRRARVIENGGNAGFGAAVNQGIRASATPYVAVLNDDTVAHPEWLESMLRAADERYETGMCAPQIRLSGEDRLDSAGMLLCRDGSSKQRGHLEPVSNYSRRRQVLLPSGCAALYKRDMLDETGLFDERFFLYCEDTDLGLRARWKLWECVYVPEAVVEHRYSHSAGSASPLKAYYVERNRLFVLVKNFPLPGVLAAPFVSLVRYLWHFVYLAGGRGKAAQHAASGGSGWKLPWYVLRAHAALIPELPRLVRERRHIQHHARMHPKQFRKMLSSYKISARQVARL